MKLLYTFLLLCFAIHISIAQDATVPDEQERLQSMILERRQLFEKYTNQIGNKSGIFGRRTKKDEAQANDILEKVIIKDNAIFQELERLHSQRKFETNTLGQRMQNQDEKLVTHVESNEKLLASLQQANLKKEELDRKANRYKFYFILSLFLNIIIASLFSYFYFARRKIKNERNS